MKTSRYLFLWCSLVVCGAPAQDPPQSAPEITSHQAPATFNSRVNLVSVPVVVRDSKGRAVGGLRQEDFRLFDKGQRQIIAKFSVIQSSAGQSSSAAAPAGAGDRRAAENADTPTAPPKPPLPDRYVAYIFDDIHLNFDDLARVRLAAERHFAEALTPASRAAIYTTSGRVTLDFTDDRL